jgi:hypothetical protein
MTLNPRRLAILAALPATLAGGTALGADLPLLDTKAIRAPWVAACNGQPDSTPLPTDPRTLVKEGVNTAGAAVQFNAWYVDLHNPPEPYVAKLPRA